MTESTDIPFYALYGEAFVRSDPGLIHVESIEIRSRELSWKIHHHRHAKLAQLIFVQEGTWQAELDDQTYSLGGSWMVTIPPGVVHGFHFSPNTSGYVLSVDTALLSDQHIQEELGDVLQQVFRPAAVTFKSEEQLMRFNHLLSFLREELQVLETDQKRYTLNLLKLILLTVARQITYNTNDNTPMQRETKIMLKFKALIEQYYLEHRGVKEYAHQLHISVSTLSRLCHQMLGESPKQVILQRLLNEGRRKLIYTRYSVEDIAYSLGYKDPAYFCRQFKQKEGLSPGDFRHKNAF